MNASPLSASRSPLEDFVRDYVEVTGGVWDEVEPQVYDVLLPAPVEAESAEAERPVLRIAFDPEALPEHPGAQLCSYGTPLVDRLLTDSIARGRHARMFVIGLNLAPHDLASRVRRALTLPEGATLTIGKVRALHFGQAVFWFQPAFVSDQKEQEVLPVAIDLHYGRQVRHLEQLLTPSRLAEHPALPYPEARRLSLAAGYPLARERVVRTIAALANTRARDAGEHADKQIARMKRYYADLRAELEEQVKRARTRGEDLTRFAGRREALEREERLRVAELRQKSTLRVQLRLLNVLLVQQPKVLVRVEVSISGKKPARAPLELVWDPLSEMGEAVPCAQCGKPTFAFALDRQGRLVCPPCAQAPASRR